MSKKYTTNFLEDTNGSTGSSNQVLVSTVSGIDWVDASGSGIIGGPYLPLSGGGMTGTLVIGSQQLKFSDAGRLFMGDSNDLQIYHDGSNSYINDVGTGDLYLQTNGTNMFLRDNASGNTFIAMNTGTADVSLRQNGNIKLTTTSTGVTVTGAATATTFLGDLNGTINTVTTAVTKANATNDTTVATTAFVQNLIGTIPAGLVFQGTWDAANNTPTLTSGSGTTGHFYIVSTSGNTNLDGVTDWVTGDWAVFIEQGGTDEWEKIDNSSVLDGTGTGQTVTLWSGSGTSNTLTNAPITVNGTTSTFAGDVTLVGGALSISSDGSNGVTFTESGNGDFTIDAPDDIRLDAGGGDIVLRVAGTEFGRISKVTNNLSITSSVTDSDILLMPNGAGNVGIGTTSPAAKLHVSDTETPEVRIEDTTNNRYLSLFQNNSNSYIQTSLNSPLVFSTHGSNERMRITTAGNVGIGTTSPERTLHVVGTGRAILVGSNNAVNIAKFYNTATTNSTFKGLDFVVNSTAAAMIKTYEMPLTFGTSNSAGVDATERMRITSAGNVGIGTTSPSEKLEVNGNILVNKGTTNRTAYVSDDGLYISRTTVANSYTSSITADSSSSGNNLNIKARSRISLILNGNTTLVADDLGRVGIGTTTPTRKLHVVNTSSQTVALFDGGNNNAGEIAFKNSTTTGDTYVTIGAIGNDMSLSAGANERMRITSSGNVGIGTTSPLYNLHIADTDATINLAKTDGDQYLRLVGGSGTNSDVIAQRTLTLQALSGNVLLQPTGNVGIGTTTPSQKLDVAGNAIFRGDIVSRDAYPSIYVDHSGTVMGGIRADATNKLELKTLTTAPIVFQVNSSEKMRILDNGNVGIGTTNPSAPLHVSKGTGNTYPTPSTNADVFIVENKNSGAGVGGGMTIFADNGATGNIYFGDEQSNQVAGITCDNFSGQTDLFFTTNGNNERLRIKGNGNVGIGTTAPTQKTVISSDGNLSLDSSTVTNATLLLSNSDVAYGTYFGSTPTGAGLIQQRRNASLVYYPLSLNPYGGNIGIGTTTPDYHLQVTGGISAGGKVTYTKSAGSLDTTGYAVAGLTTSTNGKSAGFIFTCFGGEGYQRIVYSCRNVSGTWQTSKDIDEGVNALDIVASSNATTITFTFKARTTFQNYTPKVTVEATGISINNTYA